MADPREEYLAFSRRLEWSVLIFWGLVVLLSIMFLAGKAFGAPAPFPRAASKQPLAETMRGEWLMHWSSTTWLVRLDAYGSYTAASGASVFVGTWRVCPKTRTLHITESSTPSEPRSWRYFAAPLGGGQITGDYTGPVRFERK